MFISWNFRTWNWPRKIFSLFAERISTLASQLRSYEVGTRSTIKSCTSDLNIIFSLKNWKTKKNLLTKPVWARVCSKWPKFWSLWQKFNQSKWIILNWELVIGCIILKILVTESTPKIFGLKPIWEYFSSIFSEQNNQFKIGPFLAFKNNPLKFLPKADLRIILCSIF